jgi:hypothetical protein
MTRIVTLAVCLFIFGTATAQKTQKKKEAHPNISVIPQKAGVYHKSAIGGYFTDVRKHPIRGVQAFIYLPDSTIGASGFTDSSGYYETNNIMPGMYTLKIVYPTAASVTITGVPIVHETITEISFFKTELPATDTIFSYSVIEPHPVVAEKPKKKK